MKRNKEKRKMLREFFVLTKPSKTKAGWRCPDPKALQKKRMGKEEIKLISEQSSRGA